MALSMRVIKSIISLCQIATIVNVVVVTRLWCELTWTGRWVKATLSEINATIVWNADIQTRLCFCINDVGYRIKYTSYNHVERATSCGWKFQLLSTFILKPQLKLNLT